MRDKDIQPLKEVVTDCLHVMHSRHLATSSFPGAQVIRQLVEADSLATLENTPTKHRRAGHVASHCCLGWHRLGSGDSHHRIAFPTQTPAQHGLPATNTGERCAAIFTKLVECSERGPCKQLSMLHIVTPRAGQPINGRKLSSQDLV